MGFSSQQYEHDRGNKKLMTVPVSSLLFFFVPKFLNWCRVLGTSELGGDLKTVTKGKDRCNSGVMKVLSALMVLKRNISNGGGSNYLVPGLQMMGMNFSLVKRDSRYLDRG